MFTTQPFLYQPLSQPMTQPIMCGVKQTLADERTQGSSDWSSHNKSRKRFVAAKTPELSPRGFNILPLPGSEVRAVDPSLYPIFRSEEYIMPAQVTESACSLHLREEENGSLGLAISRSTFQYPKLGLRKRSQKDIMKHKKAIFNNKRDDLFYKTLIRDVRKYFVDEFNDITSYKSFQGSGSFRASVKLMLETKIVPVIGRYQHDQDSLITFMAALISHKQAKDDIAGSEHAESIHEVYEMLYNFTKERLHAQFKRNELPYLFLFYMKMNEAPNRYLVRIGIHKTMRKNPTAYTHVYNSLTQIVHERLRVSALDGRQLVSTGLSNLR